MPPSTTTNDELCLLQDCVEDSKRRRSDRTSGGFWKTKQLTDSSSIENWLKAKKKLGKTDSSSRPRHAFDICNFCSILGSQFLVDKDGTTRSNDENAKDHFSSAAKNAKSEITLDELSDLYRCEEAEKEAEAIAEANKRLFVSAVASGMAQQPTQLRASRDELRNKKKINRLSRKTPKLFHLSSANLTYYMCVCSFCAVMSDLELPDFNSGHHHLSIDLDKGIFSRNKTKSGSTDNESNDSGNNSMNTNGSGNFICPEVVFL